MRDFDSITTGINQSGNVSVIILDDISENAAIADPFLGAEFAQGRPRAYITFLVSFGDNLLPLGEVGQLFFQLRTTNLAQEDRHVFFQESLIAFIQVTLATHSPDNAKKFRALVGRVDDIQEAYSLTGDADYVLKVVLRDLKGLSDLVNNVLMPHQSVAHVRSSIVLDRLKESTRLPLRDATG